MNDEMITPCYVISSNGFRDSVSYQDDWFESPSKHLGYETDSKDARELIKADIRLHFNTRNGIPIYFISDHGNIHRRRAIRLRKR